LQYRAGMYVGPQLGYFYKDQSIFNLMTDFTKRDAKIFISLFYCFFPLVLS
jgi:hypothetical protein